MERLPRFAQELGQLKVDVIVALSTPAARAALEATTIPVVFQVGDPVGSRLAESLARPGGSATGVSVFPYSEFHDDGVLMSYGVSLKGAAQKVAVYVDKILKGAKPADLPVEQISKYELIINLRVAHELGLEVPQSMLLSADEVIQ